MKSLIPWAILALAVIGAFFLWQKYQGGNGGKDNPST